METPKLTSVRHSLQFEHEPHCNDARAAAVRDAHPHLYCTNHISISDDYKVALRRSVPDRSLRLAPQSSIQLTTSPYCGTVMLPAPLVTLAWLTSSVMAFKRTCLNEFSAEQVNSQEAAFAAAQRAAVSPKILGIFDQPLPTEIPVSPC